MADGDAFKEGFGDYSRGVRIESNPHPLYSQPHAQWEAGWRFAENRPKYPDGVFIPEPRLAMIRQAVAYFKELKLSERAMVMSHFCQDCYELLLRVDGLEHKCRDED